MRRACCCFLLIGVVGGCGGEVADSALPDVGAAPLGEVQTVAVGERESCALTGDGHAACWSMDASTGERTPPKRVGKLPSGLHSLVVGRDHGCALTGHGSVWCWGSGELGQNGSTESHKQGVELEALHGEVDQIAAGTEHTCALLRDGSVECWGSGAFGELGNGVFESSAEPQPVLGLSGRVMQVVAGDHWSCAALEDYSVECWGAASKGMLGRAVSADSAEPHRINFEEQVTDLAFASGALGCGILPSRDVRCWGSYGDHAVTPIYSDVRPITGMHDASRIASGTQQTCAVATDGGVWCWAFNDGPRRRSAPEGVSDVSVGPRFACARNAEGVWCWILSMTDDDQLLSPNPASRIEL